MILTSQVHGAASDFVALLLEMAAFGTALASLQTKYSEFFCVMVWSMTV